MKLGSLNNLTNSMLILSTRAAVCIFGAARPHQPWPGYPSRPASANVGTSAVMASVFRTTLQVPSHCLLDQSEKISDAKAGHLNLIGCKRLCGPAAALIRHPDNFVAHMVVDHFKNRSGNEPSPSVAVVELIGFGTPALSSATELTSRSAWKRKVLR